MTRLRAAVVGLGQVGSRFDEEPRSAIWSHAGAYLAQSELFELVAGVDPNQDQRDRFARRCPAARVFPDVRTMLGETTPDVVSICTPGQGRAALVDEVFSAHTPRAIICEKPLEVTPEARAALVASCASRETHLFVDYTRRYEHVYRAAKAALDDGRVGSLVSLTVRAPNRLWTIGCHALDVMLYLAGREATSIYVLPRPSLAEQGEPAADVLLGLGDAAGHLVTVGAKANLVFEVDVVGTDGVLAIEDNGTRATIQHFSSSSSFVGYRTLTAPSELARRPSDFSPFVALVREVAAVVNGDPGAHNSAPGNVALSTECLLDNVVSKSAGAHHE